MAVYFDKQAKVFDEAPFQTSALSPIVLLAVKTYMGIQGYSSAAFNTYYDSFISEFNLRESNVTNYYVQGEALQPVRAVILNIVGDGNEFVFSTGDTNAS